MFVEEKAEIINIIDLDKDYYEIILSSPQISKLAKPGQFVNIKIQEGDFPLLRRPFSIWSAKENYIELLIKEIGIGTKILRKEKKGKISVIGPLGKPFPSPQKDDIIVLLGGGTGIVPLCFYAEKIENKKIFFIGFKHSPNPYILKRIEEISDKIFISTEDGSFGFKGILSELFKEEIEDIDSEKTKYFLCGPYEMLKTFEKILPIDRTFVSLEGIMGCGFEICMGCAVKKRDEDRYIRVCKEGPLFLLKDVEI
ncbi:MAG: dihydroorotate dehydrogenase electron transfer subunit [candidate division WOR-3 bacterium]